MVVTIRAPCRCEATLGKKVSQLRSSLVKGCPIEPWPYGNSTSINPFIVTLGVSPGVSHQKGDQVYHRGGNQFPTAGTPHPGVYYKDTKKYWCKIRFLAQTTLEAYNVGRDDALSLFGNLNLDTRRNASPDKASVDPAFATWVLQMIRCKLRPHFVVMLGMLGFLRNNKSIHEAFNKSFSGFNVNDPHHTFPFKGYKKKQFQFRQWNFGDLTLVMWPQSPTHSPFASNLEAWKAACGEFVSEQKNAGRIK